MILAIGAAVYAILFFLMRKDMLRKGAEGIRRASGLAAAISMLCMFVNTVILGKTDIYSTDYYGISDYDPVNFPALILLLVNSFIFIAALFVETIKKRKAYDRKLLREMEQGKVKLKKINDKQERRF